MKKKTAAFSTKTLLTIHNGYLNTLAHKNTAHNIKKKSHRDKIKFVLHYKRTSLFLRYLKKQKQKKKKSQNFCRHLLNTAPWKNATQVKDATKVACLPKK